MKKMNKKGFTIVELVIVIAVIAVLAGVMIPTFTGILNTAHESAALQRATAAYKDAYGVALSDDGYAKNETKEANGFTFVWDANGACTVTAPADFGYNVSVSNGVVSVTKVTTPATPSASTPA